MKVAIPKVYFSIDPQDNMDGYLKNTVKMATLTLRILDREQKINNCLKTIWRRRARLLSKRQIHKWSYGEGCSHFLQHNGLIQTLLQLRRSLGFGRACLLPFSILKFGLSSVTEPDWKTEDTYTVTTLLMIS